MIVAGFLKTVFDIPTTVFVMFVLFSCFVKKIQNPKAWNLFVLYTVPYITGYELLFLPLVGMMVQSQ